MRLVLAGNMVDTYGKPIDNPVVEIKMQMLEASGDWKAQARQSIDNKSGT